MALPRTACILHATVGRFRSCLQKWGIRGMVPIAACECGAEEQTIGHVAVHSPIHRPLYGARSIAGKLSTGLCVCAGGLDIKTIDETPLIHSVSYFNLGAWNLTGRAKPTKDPRGDWTAWSALPDSTGWREIEYDCSTPGPASRVAKRWTSRTGSNDEEEVLIFIGTALHKECYNGQEVATRSPT